MKHFKTLGIILMAFLLASCGAKHTLLKMETTHGDITLKLYDATEKHRANFKKLAENGFYDSLLFHRVIEEFMIQGGDPDSKNAKSGESLGNGGPGYRVEAEIMPGRYFHKKGALAAAREGDRQNLDRESSGSQFYIVQGKTFTDEELDKIETRIRQRDVQWHAFRYLDEHQDYAGKFDSLQRSGKRREAQELMKELTSLARQRYEKQGEFSFSDEQRKVYREKGGTPHLDGAYTVFGEVTQGVQVVDEIAGVETDNANRPKTDVRILGIEVLKK